MNKGLLIFFVLVCFSNIAFGQTANKRTMCIWDPTGNQGPVYSFFFDTEVNALSWGIDLERKAYETEVEVLNRLEDGSCDLAVVTAILARQYVRFGGTLDAIGGITDRNELKLLLATITRPEFSRAMSEGEFEIAGVLPLGAMYAFVNDRRITYVEQFKRKRIAALNGDVQIKKLADLSDAIPINTTIDNFADLFKSRNIDIVLMPALAYNAFELDDGLGKQGGIIDIRFFNGMLQVISKKDRFDDDFGTQFRRYLYGRFDDIVKMIKTAESEIPEHFWIKTSQTQKRDLNELAKDIRLQLLITDQLDRRALTLLWRIRCQSNPQNKECVLPN